MAQSTFFAFFFKYLKPYATRVFVTFILLLTANAVTLIGPLVFKEIIDQLDHGLAGDMGISKALVLLLFSYALARFGVAVLTEVRELVFVPVARAVLQHVQIDLYRHLLSLPLAYHRKRETGAVTQAMQQGLRGLQAITSYTIYSILPTVSELIFGIGLLAWQYPWPIAAVVAVGVFLYLLYTQPMTRRLAAQRLRINQLDAKAHQIGYEMLLNVELVQSANGWHRESNRLQEVLDGHRLALLGSARWSSVLNLGQQFIMIACTSGALLLAIWGHRSQVMSTGDVVLVMALVIQAFTPLNTLGGVYQEIRHALVDLQTVLKMLSEPSLNQASRPTQPVDAGLVPTSAARVEPKAPPGIKLEGVSAMFDDGPGLTGLNLEVPSGHWVAIVGPSGSGKTTLTRLICGQIKPDAGRLEFHGPAPIELNDTNRHEWVGMMPSMPPLFSVSIEANIRYPMDVPAPLQQSPEFIRASQSAGLHEWVSSLPFGYATILEESGGSLSAGEKQRIGLARLFLRAPPVMVFDEPTSALDPEMDQKIMQSIQGMSGAHTVIVIAHRLRSIVQADSIVVMEGGKMIDHGTHEDLLKRCPLYQRMWSAQLDL